LTFNIAFLEKMFYTYSVNVFHIHNNFKGRLAMPKNHFKQAVSTAISLSIVANMAAPVHANELAPVAGKFCPPLSNSN
jgi:hypothetical protein